jgi:hypothetical protein
MIDTVHIFSPAPLVVSNLPTSWRRSISDKQVPDPDGIGFIPASSFSFDDGVSGYHAYGEREEIRYHRASLPRLLFGHNGKLIKSQAELDAAMDLLQQNAGEICNASFANLHYTRVDLVWQFRGDTADFILAHRHARHPRIHRDPIFYEARSMALKGSEMRITMYDKVLKEFKCQGDVVRVEIQLKGRRLMEELGNGNKVTKIDFYQCYQTYRRILLGFDPNPIATVSNIAEFLAIAERERWQSNGISAFELYTKNLSKRHLRRLQRDMAVCRPEVFKINWAELLPADATPPAVEIMEVSRFAEQKRQ